MKPLEPLKLKNTVLYIYDGTGSHSLLSWQGQLMCDEDSLEVEQRYNLEGLEDQTEEEFLVEEEDLGFCGRPLEDMAVYQSSDSWYFFSDGEFHKRVKKYSEG